MPRKNYEKMLRAIRPFITTTIKNRKHFTPQQKSAITRHYNKIGYASSNKSNVKFVKLKGAKLKAAKKTGILSTGRGVFIKKKAKKLVVKGDKVQIIYEQRKDTFVPLPAFIFPEDFPDWAAATAVDNGFRGFGIALNNSVTSRTWIVRRNPYTGDAEVEVNSEASYITMLADKIGINNISGIFMVSRPNYTAP